MLDKTVKNTLLAEFLKFNSEFRLLMNMFDEKDSLRRRFSYAVPCEEEALAIKSFLGDELDIVEHGAGTGYWAWYLGQFDIKVNAYDKYFLKEQFFVNDGSIFHQVQIADENILSLHSNKPLLLCWPPYNDKMALSCLKFWYKKDLTQKLIYIGEGFGGATANDEFHDFVEQNFDEVMYLDQKFKFVGVHSWIFFYKSKGK